MDVKSSRVQGQNWLFQQVNVAKESEGDRPEEKNKIELWFSGLITVIVLVMGGVKMNPGPLSIKKQKFWVHKRDGGKRGRSKKIHGSNWEKFGWNQLSNYNADG